MKIFQARWTEEAGWWPALPECDDSVQVVWLFGASAAGDALDWLAAIRRAYPRALLLGCSTAGEILGTTVADGTVVATAAQFKEARVEAAWVELPEAADSRAAGRRLAAALPPALPGEAPGEGPFPLVHVFVLSAGLQVNGSELVRGLADGLAPAVTVTGGLAGDGSRFQRTWVLHEEKVGERLVAAVGFYGRLQVGVASMGGWDPFGPERLITRAEGNVLYELDGRPALDLYKNYLGDHARELPSAGLLFPLCIRLQTDEEPVVRTILAVDEAAGSLVFAGDMPEGGFARLMKANFDRLIDGAAGAAAACAPSGDPPALAILISCVGRKLLLRQRVEEEVEAVREVFGEATALAGFYAYGEISPFTPEARCELHNQTMTITTFREP